MDIINKEIIDLATKIEFWVWEAKQTILIREKMCNNTFLEDNDLMNDLFDETPIQEESCQRKKPRIGPEYQAIIPDIKVEKKNVFF